MFNYHYLLKNGTYKDKDRIPKDKRDRTHSRPDKFQKCLRRSWLGQIKIWGKALFKIQTKVIVTLMTKKIIINTDENGENIVKVKEIKPDIINRKERGLVIILQSLYKQLQFSIATQTKEEIRADEISHWSNFIKLSITNSFTQHWIAGYRFHLVQFIKQLLLQSFTPALITIIRSNDTNIAIISISIFINKLQWKYTSPFQL
ncbi:hypothetical protein ACTA71_010231 [Dictyostelium dimigraforme]